MAQLTQEQLAALTNLVGQFGIILGVPGAGTVPMGEEPGICEAVSDVPGATAAGFSSTLPVLAGLALLT
jgi:hypothetical protein